MSPEKQLWQSVVWQAVVDATHPKPTTEEAIDAQRKADRWLTVCGKDFRNVCEMADMGPAFISEAYKSGGIDRDILKAASEIRRPHVEL